MDISVIKEQLGNFATFVRSINHLLSYFPEGMRRLASVVDGKADLMAENNPFIKKS